MKVKKNLCKKGLALFTIVAMSGTMLAPPMMSFAGSGEASIGETVYTTFEDALSHIDGESTIKLMTNVDVSDTEIVFNQDTTLDLAGYDLKTTNGPNRIRVIDGAELTLIDSSEDKDGTIYSEIPYGGDYKSGLIKVEGEESEFIMNSGNIYSVMEDASNGGQFGVTSIDGGDITINGGRIEAGWYAVASNGTDQTHNTVITINGGELISTADYAIYHPAKGSVQVNDGVIYGQAGGIFMNSGNLDVKGGTITSKGIGNTGTWGDGTGNASNAAINLSAKYRDVESTISGGKIIAEGNAVVIKATENKYDLDVTGGSFSSDPSEYVESPYCVNAVNGFYNVYDEGKAVKINDEFSSLENAFYGAEPGDYIKVLQDLDISNLGDLNISHITLDLNGHSIYCDNFTTIIVGEDGIIKNGKMIANNSGSYALFVGDDGVATNNILIEDVEFLGGINAYNTQNVVVKDCNVTATNYYAVWLDENATLKIDGGTYQTSDTGRKASSLLGATKTSAEPFAQSVLTIKDGNFNVAQEKELFTGEGVLVANGGKYNVNPSDYTSFPYAVVDADEESDYNYEVYNTLNDYTKAVSEYNVNVSYRDGDLETVNKIKDEAIKNIGSANSKEAVLKIVENAKAEIDKIPTAADRDAEDLLKAKNDGINELTTYKSNVVYRTSELAKVNSIKGNAKISINACNDITKINGIVAGAKAEIDKVLTDAQLTSQEIARFAKVKVSLSTYTYTYTGKTKKPTVTVKNQSGKKLVEGIDYKLTRPSSSYKPGVYTIKITGLKDYKGTKTIGYKINPKQQKITSLKGYSKSLKVYWSKDTKATGYQVKIARNKSFTSSLKTYKTSSYSKTSVSFSKLSKGKYYYATVRSYKKVGSTYLYGAWSTAKRVKVK